MCDPGTAITVALAVGSTASSLYQAQQQKKAMAYQQQMEQQKLAIQQRQQQQIAEGEALAMRQRITERKRIAAEEYEQNRSIMVTPPKIPLRNRSFKLPFLLITICFLLSSFKVFHSHEIKP